MPSIYTIANLAGVSASTVSRVFSRPELVNDETRARIMATAKKLGYEPNRAARGLITGKTRNIGLLVPDIANPFFPPIIKSAQRHAARGEYAVFLADSDEVPQAESDVLRKMARDVDGVLLVSPRMSDEAIAQLAHTMTIVTINRKVEGVPAVLMALGDGARQSLDHLAALGHTDIAYLSGPPSSWANLQKRRGAQVSARRAGVKLSVLGPFAPTHEGGIIAADAVVAGGVSAFLAFNDVMALGALSRLRERGIDVPGDISVASFDNIAAATTSTPALTTVSVPGTAVGAAAIDMLVRMIETGDRSSADVFLPTQLLVRKSTAQFEGRGTSATARA